MDGNRNSVVVTILLLLLLINLVVPIAYLTLRPEPAVAASTATYTEEWEAQKCIISYAWVTWNWSRIANSQYIEVAPSQVSNYWTGQAYGYTWSWSNDAWSVSPHGLVTEWKVTGKLTQQ